ncbi:MAG: hypothetical protein MH208_05870 [Marinobacter sp.]|nr:hypothetical protein [Marinobacter sp.]
MLDATGTPVDQAVYISLDSMEAMHVGWESGVGHSRAHVNPGAGQTTQSLPRPTLPPRLPA